MNFLNPLVLIGLVAAGIPVLLHLLNLRKLKTIEFSSLKFLKELQKTQIRKLKLKQILLLILRTLLIIFAVLAFARPTIPGSIPFFESYSKTSAIVLVDNSFSTDISDEYGNRFNQSKNAVLSIIQNLSDGDEIAIVPMSGESSLAPVFTRNFDYAVERLNSITISQMPSNLNRSLRISESLVSDAANLNKEIYIISDAQTNTFNLLNNDTVRLKSLVSSVIYVPVGMGANADLQNLSVDSVKIISAIFQQDKLVETEAYIRNNSKNSINDVVVSMKFNGKPVAQRSADINAGETKSFLIAANPGQSGPIKASVELESDVFDYDNSRFFGFNIPPKPRLLVAGTQNPNPFVKVALSAFAMNENQQNIKFISSDRLSSEDFGNYNAVIITGGSLVKNDYTRLSQYVNSGGALFVFANPDTEFDSFAGFLKATGIGNIKERKFSQSEPASFANVDRQHPIFEGVFDDKPGTSQIESPKIMQSMPSESGLAIISMPGGAFLAESRTGEGKLIYCAITPDGDWSNFPFTGIFPTLIYRSVLYLTSSEDLSINIKAGESLIYKIPNRFSNSANFKITDPNGNEFFNNAVNLPQGKVLSLEKINIPGIYTIFDEKDEYVAQIAANLDESESQIAGLDEAQLSKILEERIIDTPISIIDNVQDLSAGITRVRTGTELWQIFILLALICAITEMIVARVSRSEVAPV
jgi:hypothetical protein